MRGIAIPALSLIHLLRIIGISYCMICLFVGKATAQQTAKTDWVKKLKELAGHAPALMGEWKIERALAPNPKLALRMEKDLNVPLDEKTGQVAENSRYFDMINQARKGSNPTLHAYVNWQDSNEFSMTMRFDSTPTASVFSTHGDGKLNGIHESSGDFQQDTMKLLHEIAPGIPTLYAWEWFNRIAEAEVEQEDDHLVQVCAEFPSFSGYLVVRLAKPEMHFLSIQCYRGTWLHASAQMRAQSHPNASMQEEWEVIHDGSQGGLQTPQEVVVRHFHGLYERQLWQEDRWQRASFSTSTDSQKKDDQKR